MTEPETEIDTLDRLEAALGRIAASTRAPTPGTDDRRRQVAEALDRMIAQLRAALAEGEPPQHPVQSEGP